MGSIGGKPRVSLAGVGHFHAASRSAVVVTVAKQRDRVVDDRVGVVGGDARDGVARDDDAVCGVHRVHDEIGDRDVDRYADGDDRRHPEVAQDRVEVGATHRADAVPPVQHDIVWGRAEFGQQRGALTAGTDVDLLSSHHEDRRIVVRAEPVGPPLHQAVHDTHAGVAGGRQQPFDVGQRLASRLLGEHGEAGVGPDDGALEFLRDDRRVAGRRDLGEVDAHTDAGTS